jgi:hypothetical protein
MGTIKKTLVISLKTLVRHPKLFVPYLIFQSMSAIISYLFILTYMGTFGMTAPNIDIERILWQIAVYLFILVTTPFFEGWIYFMLVIWFTEGRVSLQEGMLNSKRKYLGFLGLELVYLTATSLVMIPCAIIFIALLTGVALSRVTFMGTFPTTFLMLLALFIMTTMTLSALISVLFAYVKPVYAHVGDFFESVKEGIGAAWKTFWNTALMVIVVFILGVIIYTPSIILVFELIKNMISHPTAFLPFQSVHFPFWFFLNAAIMGVLTHTFLACAFTHYYLTYRKWI